MQEDFGGRGMQKNAEAVIRVGRAVRELTQQRGGVLQLGDRKGVGRHEVREPGAVVGREERGSCGPHTQPGRKVSRHVSSKVSQLAGEASWLVGSELRIIPVQRWLRPIP